MKILTRQGNQPSEHFFQETGISKIQDEPGRWKLSNKQAEVSINRCEK